MKIANVLPGFAATLVVAFTMFATAADDDMHLYKDVEPPRVEIEGRQATLANGEELMYNGEQQTNGETQETADILLPAPRPVEPTRPVNGETETRYNGDLEFRNGEAEYEYQREAEVEANGEVLSEWPRYPYGQYLYGENGQANGENGEWQEIEANGELNDDAELYTEKEHQYKDKDGELKGEHKARTEPYHEKDGEVNGEMYFNGENGEWQEVETNGEESVTPYTDKEMEYKDRDGENGDGGWYDDDDEEFEFLRNRTGHRWGWPGRK